MCMTSLGEFSIDLTGKKNLIHDKNAKKEDWLEKSLLFNRGLVNVKVKLTLPSSDLKLTEKISEEEVEYIKVRKNQIFRNRGFYTGFYSSKVTKVEHIPTVGVLGSGGGTRASIGFAGAMAGLEKLGVLENSCYVGALSGSSWFSSLLYTNDEWLNHSADNG